MRNEPPEPGMPILAALSDRFAADPPLAGRRVAAMLNITPEATALVRVLAAAGARLLVGSSKPATFDAASAERIAGHAELLTDPVFPGDKAAARVLGFAPELLIDNGALTALWAASTGAPPVIGGTVHSQNALNRVRAAGGGPPFGLCLVTRSPLKSTIETGHGTGQAAVDALRSAGLVLAGKRVLVVGCGVAGRAVADYARGSHARVAVSEVDPVAALRAVYLGYDLVPLAAGLTTADVVVTVTDVRHALTVPGLRLLRDGAVIGGIGHSRDEIDRAGLAAAATAERRLPGGVEYVLDGRRVTLLEGPGGNHVFAGINPPEMMDISFALHALCLVRLAAGPPLPAGLHPVPYEVDAEVARTKLATLGLDGALG